MQYLFRLEVIHARLPLIRWSKCEIDVVATCSKSTTKIYYVLFPTAEINSRRNCRMRIVQRLQRFRGAKKARFR